MLEANNWYKVMDSNDMRTLIFAPCCIFKVLSANSYVTTVFSATTKRKYHILNNTISSIRTIKLDSKAAELLYSKVEK